MPSIINASTSGAGGVVTTADSSGVLQLQTAGTTALTIDTSQNVGIGTASPLSRLQIIGQSGFGGGAANSATTISTSATGNDAVTLELATGSGSPFSLSLFANGASPANAVYLNQRNNAPMVFQTNNTERLRIGGDGNIVQTSGIGIRYSGISGGNFIGFKWTSPNVIARIDNALDVTLANVSDYRIKKNIKTQTTPALERIAQLRPVNYEIGNYKELFKEDGIQREGFIAHEVAEVIPSAVEGEKDAEDQIQSLKLDALCSVMVKAIQEQQTIINDLKARITALEGAK